MRRSFLEPVLLLAHPVAALEAFVELVFAFLVAPLQLLGALVPFVAHCVASFVMAFAPAVATLLAPDPMLPVALADPVVSAMAAVSYLAL